MSESLTKEYWDAEGTPGLVRKDELPNIAAMTHVDKERASDTLCDGLHRTQHCASGHDKDCGE